MTVSVVGRSKVPKVFVCSHAAVNLIIMSSLANSVSANVDNETKCTLLAEMTQLSMNGNVPM